jgi:folate-dependent phosphoribosylglycinamide formyltransferase PurN
MRIAVTSGYSRSLHSIALIHQLKAQGHQVPLCLRAKVLTWKRVRHRLRQYGLRKAWKSLSERFFRLKGTPDSAPPELTAMLNYFHEHQIPSRRIAEACQAIGAKEVVVKSLNDPPAIAALRAANVDLVVYAGGGILRSEIIGLPRLGVLNGHGGPLPQFRGMNVAEWAVLYGVKPSVSVHWIDVGVDTGPIAYQKPIPSESWTDVDHGRGAGAKTAVEALLEAVARLDRDDLHSVSQRPENGRLFHVMASPLVEVLNHWLSQGRKPQIEPTDFAFPSLAETFCNFSPPATVDLAAARESG